MDDILFLHHKFHWPNSLPVRFDTRKIRILLEILIIDRFLIPLLDLVLEATVMGTHLTF